MASRKDWESYKNVVEDLTNCGVEKQSWGKRSNVNKDLHESFQQARQKEKKFDGDIAGFSSSDDDDETNATGFTSANMLAAKRALTARKTTSKKPKRQKKCDEDYNSPCKWFPQTTFANQPLTTPCTSLGTPPAPSRTPTPSRTPAYSRIPAYSRASTPGTSRTPIPSKTSTLAPSRTPVPGKTSTLAPSRTPVPSKKSTLAPSRTPVPSKTSTLAPSRTPVPSGTHTPAYSRTPVPSGTHTPAYSRTSTPGTSSNKRSNLGAGKWKLFPNRFESSFTSESPSLSHPSSAQEDIKDEITWSESDSEDREIYLTDEAESPAGTPEDKIPLSTQSVIQQQQSQGSGNIGEYESDSESFTKHLDVKESSPGISPNTPTPTPTPCTPPKEGEACPPVDSTKKGKRKYLRNGLAERLQKLTMQENCNRSFWRHKTQQRNEQNDDDSPSSSPEGTLTVRVMSESLDHSVYILTCHVLSQDIEPFLPKHVTILLESDRRKHLDINMTSTCLRIYSPWKILHLPESSEPVLMCMAHCEIIPSLDLISEDISDPSDDQQTQTEVSHPAIVKEKIDEIRRNTDMENEEDQDEGRNETVETVVEWDSLGYEGVSMTTMVNVTARIQRIYWRNLETRDDNLNSASSLTMSIIQNAKILNKEKRMSLCCLAQGLTSVCCEVQLREDILLNRTDWHEVLCHSEGTVLCFSKLRLVEHRNRKRARQLFSLIDSLKTTRSEKQQSCFVFTLDDQSTVQLVSEDKVSDYPNYSSPQSLNDLNSDIDNRRVSFCGKLLHAKFTNDKYYNTKHVRLWLSRKTIPQDCAESDVTPEPTISGIQVCYSSGRKVEWNESTLSAGQLLSMQDLVFDKVKSAILSADIFSKIQVIIPQSSRPDCDDASRDIHEIWRRTMTATMTDEEYTCLKSLPVAVLPGLNGNCGGDCLVMCEGIISGVDDENAFCWYSCCHCGSEDISEISNSSSQYHCNACSLEFTSPVTNIHLEIYLTSASTSAFKVKVKLLQKTTKHLLSGSEKTNRETYNVNSVLNKHLGPIHCYIAERIQDKNLKISFKLEELDSSS